LEFSDDGAKFGDDGAEFGDDGAEYGDDGAEFSDDGAEFSFQIVGPVDAGWLVERRASNRKVAKPWFDYRCGSASLCP